MHTQCISLPYILPNCVHTEQLIIIGTSGREPHTNHLYKKMAVITGHIYVCVYVYVCIYVCHALNATHKES